LDEFDLLPEFSLEKMTHFFTIQHQNLAKPDISFSEKQTEDLIYSGDWGYFSPAGWIRYPFKDESILPDTPIVENWPTLYHGLNGLDFSSYGNLVMCDDNGPNRFDVELSNYPMHQGLYVTPKLSILTGNNSREIYHISPFKIFDREDKPYYFLIAFECYANPNKIRVPSSFVVGKNNLKKVYGEYYLINEPRDLVLKSLLMKRITEYFLFLKKL
jgi:hypothetical protein